MFRLATASCLFIGLLSTSASAQDIKKSTTIEPAKTKTPVGTVSKTSRDPVPGEADVHFLNGSTVRMVVQSEKLEVATQYGKLFVPVKDVRAIEFGLHFPEDVQGKIDQALKNLSSNDYREREKASKSLLDFGPYSYPSVLEASRARDSETSQRAKEVLKKLQASHPKKDLKTSAEDKVVTPTFTIVGRILTSTIKAKTDYFGDVELSLTKMRTLRAVDGGVRELDVVLDAGKYANQGQWMETEFVVDGRSNIVITAKGFIDLLPRNAGGNMCGPNGWQAQQNGIPALAMGGRKIGPVVNMQLHCGMLLAKVGDHGEMFTVGEHYEGNPEAEGKLYLHIGPSQWNCPSSGTFDVKITRK
jgi:hypothetical protein